MNIKRILILSAVCVCAAACNYLDVVPLGSPKMDDLFRTHTQANKFACAMYSHVYQPNKYDINASMELCGGSHVKNVGQIGMFKIVSESSVAAGVRRIEAITGKKLEDMLYTMEDTIKGMRALFNNAPDLMGTLQRYISEHDDMKKEIEKFQAQAVENMKNQLVAHAESHNGVKVVKAVLPIAANAAKDLVFKVREAIPENLFCVIGSTENGRPLISVMISDDLVKNHELNAGALVREAGKLIQGGGGGQPHYATAGGKNADGLSAAVDKVIELAKL